MSLGGLAVTTVEGINVADGSGHPVQKALASAGASQCGFCTPGMAMAAYSLLEAKSPGIPTREEVRKAIDGNLCRCTGYRPILDSLGVFAAPSAAPPGQGAACASGVPKDIEDMGKAYCHSKGGATHARVAAPPPRASEARFGDSVLWITATTLAQVEEVRARHPRIRFVVGNTMEGPYGPRVHPVSVNIRDVPELRVVKVERNGITFGSAVTISNLIAALDRNVRRSPTTFPAFIAHLSLIAGKHVRDNGSWAGNLMMQKLEGFPSDLVTVLAAAKVLVTVSVGQSPPRQVPVGDEFFALPNDGLFVRDMFVPFSGAGEVAATYRTALRPWNAHALLNAGFTATLDGDKVASVKLVYGVISRHIVRASQTEAFLTGKSLRDPAVAAEALRIVSAEIVPGNELQYVTITQPKGKDLYRKDLIPTFLYKFLITLMAKAAVPVPPRLARTAAPVDRPMSTGTQDVADPLGRGTPKTDSILQSTGRAVYADDLPVSAGTLYGCLVGATRAHAKILTVDASAALAVPGVVDFVAANDVPGANDIGVIPGEEPLFATDTVVHYGQPIGMVLARTQALANRVAALVKVTYKDHPAVVSIEDGVAAGSFLPLCDHAIKVGDVEAELLRSDRVVQGRAFANGQLHFYMEKISCVVTPGEGSYTVDCTNQAPDIARAKLTAVMGLGSAGVHLRQRRAGGGFGGKITRNLPLQAAALVASKKHGVPIRAAMSIAQDHMITGGRHEFLSDYTVGFNLDGTLRALRIRTFGNGGFSTDLSVFLAPEFNESLDGVYYWPAFDSEVKMVKTNTPTRSAVRSFGHVQAVAICEQIVEAVADSLGVAPEVVREANHYRANTAITPYGQHIDHLTLPQMWAQLKVSAELERRRAEVRAFNAANLHKKRGLSMMGAKYGIGLGYASGATVLVSVAGDGTSFVHHSGSEIGQGLSTKVQQMVATTLGAPLASVKVVDGSTDTVAVQTITGGSGASEINAEAARLACVEINARLASVRRDLKPGAPWGEVVAAATARKISLTASAIANAPGRSGGPSDGPNGPWQKHGADYFAQGVVVAEALVDVLTGEVAFPRVDVLYDAGQSLNPVIDLGQTEGAFVFGLGYFVTEEPLVDKNGASHSLGTWEYKPPAAINIPADFRVAFLKDSPYPKGIGGTKATGEPPLLLSYACFGAVKQAVNASRILDRSLPPAREFFPPATPDRVREAAEITNEDLVIKAAM